MRTAWLFLFGVSVVGCGGGGLKTMVSACERAQGADPGACLAVARDKLARKDQGGVQKYMESTVQAINAAPTCLNDHPARSCFAGVGVLLRDEPTGLLAGYEVTSELLSSVPRWNGSDAEGPRAQARIALQGMCTSERGNPIERQRACLVLGDLVEDERMRRCGPKCDLSVPNEALAGWGKADVIDGYAQACTLAKTASDPAFTEQVVKIYGVAPADAVCSVSKADLRGSSIPNAVAGRARAIFEANQQAAAAKAAEAREASRAAQMKKRDEEQRAAAAKLEAENATTRLVNAANTSDWATTLDLLRKRRSGQANATAATAISRQWDAFVAWQSRESSVIAAYLEVAEAVRALAPAGHALHGQLTELQTRALAEVKKRALTARGAGSVWLYAALAERVAGPNSSEASVAADAYAKVANTARVSLVIDKLAPACASIRPEMRRGRTVRAVSTLQCTIEPEKTWTTTEVIKVKQRVVKSRPVMKNGREETVIDSEEDVETEVPNEVVHRTYKLVVHGHLAITGGSMRRAVPIEIEDVLEDGAADGEGRTFEAARTKAIAQIQAAVLGPIEALDAEAAYAAAQKALNVQRIEAAENHLVMHALIAGSSPELDEILSQYGVAFAELLPPAKSR